MKKLILAVCLAAVALAVTSCGASRRGTGCPSSWEGYRYRG